MNRPEAGLPYPYYLFVCIYFCKYNMLQHTFTQKRFWSRDRDNLLPPVPPKLFSIAEVCLRNENIIHFLCFKVYIICHMCNNLWPQ